MKDCFDVARVCAARYDGMLRGSNFSQNYQERRDSCIVTEEYGYFSHPGKVMKGKLYALKEVMGNGKADRCAEECDKVPDCQGMAVSASPASFLLFGGEALHFCDSTAADCGGAAIDPADKNSIASMSVTIR